MKKKLLLILIFSSIACSAQDFEWQWATRGGGTKSSPSETGSVRAYDSEQIIDIAVDADNNYYYLAIMTQNDTEYNETPVVVYNPQNQSSGMTDIVLISTDCSGTLRWTQTIGGGGRDSAYKIVLDGNGGLYLGANIINLSNSQDEYLPPHFSPDDSMPVLESDNGQPQEGYKTIALLKYNTNDGSLVWRVMPQGDVTLSLRYAHINQVAIDSQGIIHTLIGFTAGTHLNGAVTVPETFTTMYRYHIVKFSQNGEVLSFLPLTLEGILLEHNTYFRYNETLQRYYLAGFRNYGATDSLFSLSFNNIPFTEQAYILGFDAMGEEVIRNEILSESTWSDDRIYDLEIDDESNLYISGLYNSNYDEYESIIGNYTFPTNLSGNIPYVLKLNAAGVVQWINIPSSYSETVNPNQFSGIHFPLDITLNGNEIAVATQISEESWGQVSIDRPDNHLSDPGLLRLNKETGQAVALHDIMTSAGSRDGLSAVAFDNDGNYILGGYFYNDLFTLEDDGVETLTKVAGQPSYTDFFIAKLANSACGSGTLGVNGHSYNSIKIYPNPSQDVVNIESQETLISYTVTNLLGQVLQSGEFKASQNTVTLESLTSGTYILNVYIADGRVLSHKIIKE